MASSYFGGAVFHRWRVKRFSSSASNAHEPVEDTAPVGRRSSAATVIRRAATALAKAMSREESGKAPPHTEGPNDPEARASACGSTNPRHGAGRIVRQIGRAHVWTPVTNAHLVCRLLL